MPELWHHPELPRQRVGGQALEVPQMRTAVRRDGGRCELRIDAGRPRSMPTGVASRTRHPPEDRRPGRPAASSLGDQDLRETFDLPLMSGRDAERAGAAAGTGDRRCGGTVRRSGGPKRRITAADARARARRCSCGGFVPQGMSICISCGVDQETGLRVGLEDDLAPAPASAPSARPCMWRSWAASCGVAGLTLLILSLIRSVGGEGRVAELRLALPGHRLGLRHLRLGAIHPAQVRQAPHGRPDPRRRHRPHGPDRHAADPGQLRGPRQAWSCPSPVPDDPDDSGVRSSPSRTGSIPAACRSASSSWCSTPSCRSI